MTCGSVLVCDTVREHEIKTKRHREWRRERHTVPECMISVGVRECRGFSCPTCLRDSGTLWYVDQMVRGQQWFSLALNLAVLATSGPAI